MKSFTIASVLASTAAALPAALGAISTGVSSCDGQLTAGAISGLHSVVTITTKASKNVLMEFTPMVAAKIGGLHLGSLNTPIGTITQVASSVSGLSLSGLSTGYLTVATSEGQVALVQLTSDVESVLAGVTLPQVGTLVGGLVGTVEGLVSGDLVGSVEGLADGGVSAKGSVEAKKEVHGSISGKDVMSIVGQNGDNILFQVEPTLFSLIANLPLINSFTGPIGSVIGQVPAGSDLVAKATSLGADPSKLIAVLTENGASVLLVEVEDTLSGLMSTFGLSVVQSTIGSVVPAGAANILKRDPVSNVMRITDLNGNTILAKIEPTLFGLLSQLPMVGTLEGPVGSVIGQVPVGSDLIAKATSLGADPSQLIAILSQNGASVLLVEVEDTLSGLLSTFGLSVVQSTIGSVVPAGAAGLL